MITRAYRPYNYQDMNADLQPNRDKSNALGTGDNSIDSTNEAFARGYSERPFKGERLQSGEFINSEINDPANYIENYFKMSWKGQLDSQVLAERIATPVSEMTIQINRVHNRIIAAKYGGTPASPYGGMTSNVSTTEGV